MYLWRYLFLTYISSSSAESWSTLSTYIINDHEMILRCYLFFSLSKCLLLLIIKLCYDDCEMLRCTKIFLLESVYNIFLTLLFTFLSLCMSPTHLRCAISKFLTRGVISTVSAYGKTVLEFVNGINYSTNIHFWKSGWNARFSSIGKNSNNKSTELQGNTELNHSLSI